MISFVAFYPQNLLFKNFAKKGQQV